MSGISISQMIHLWVFHNNIFGFLHILRNIKPSPNCSCKYQRNILHKLVFYFAMLKCHLNVYYVPCNIQHINNHKLVNVPIARKLILKYLYSIFIYKHLLLIIVVCSLRDIENLSVTRSICY